MRTGLTIGTFDPVHVDHVLFLRRCLEHCEVLIVGVNSDAFVFQYRGREPMYTEDERMEMVRALGHSVRLNDGPGRELLEIVGPHVLLIGSDWLAKDYLHQIDVTPEMLGDISLVYVPYGRHVTSSDLKRRAREA